MKKLFLTFFIVCFLVGSSFGNCVLCNEKPERSKEETTSFSVLSKILDCVVFPSVQKFITENYSDKSRDKINFKELVQNVQSLAAGLCQMLKMPITKVPNIYLLEVKKEDCGIVNYIVLVEFHFADFDQNYEEVPLNVVIVKGFLLFPENKNVQPKQPV